MQNEMFLVTDLIRKKRFGHELTTPELDWLVSRYVSGTIKDYQMAAWLMAVCLRGMSERETVDLTHFMRDSGQIFDFSSMNKFCVDKHSTGGVGDKTSLIIAPLVAAAGLNVPMVAGRGLAHTGGTLDKLESIPGFNVHLSRERFTELVGSLGFAIMGQTEDMCPADKKLYALRDVTGTVDSQPLICASIMSKKLAGGMKGLVLDVKHGSGAFMKTIAEARSLGVALKKIGESSGLQVRVVLSNMNQPLGRYAGNALEVLECVEILQGKTKMEFGTDFYADTRTLSLELSAHMIQMAAPGKSIKEARALAEGLLSSGKAYENFIQMCLAQGQGFPKSFTCPYEAIAVTAPQSGYIESMNTELFGLAGIELGVGRKTAEATIDPWAGMEFAVKVGSPVQSGQAMVFLYASSPEKTIRAANILSEAITISTHPKNGTPLIAEVF